MRKNPPAPALLFIVFGLVLSFFYYIHPVRKIYSNGVFAQTDGISITVTVTQAVCGNSVIETGEECDGVNNLGGQTCVGLGYTGGALGCTAACDFDTTACTSGGGGGNGGGGGGGGGYTLPPLSATRVILQGKAYPNAKLTVLIDGAVATLIYADSQANFKTEISTLGAGIYTFSLWAEDKESRKSITFSFTGTIVKDMTTTISNIFIPPTIELAKVNLDKGEELDISGQTTPKSEIIVSIESPQEIIKKTIAKENGDWKDTLDTSPLEEGVHTTRAKAKTPEGLQSSYSTVMAFYVGKYGTSEISPRADFNKDGRTNLADFSILLYWWGKYYPAADQNQDGIVNLADFSILLYYWTG